LEKKSGGRFRAEYALEARSSELYADGPFTSRVRIANVDNAAVGGEIRVTISGGRKTVSIRRATEAFGLGTARTILCQRYTDFEIGADGDIKTCDKSGAVAAKIFAGGLFFEGKGVGVAL